MDGQGILQKKTIQSVLSLTNLVVIHFMNSDCNDAKSKEELEMTLRAIKKADENIQICLILRDHSKT
jgi:hypothetical protein